MIFLTVGTQLPFDRLVEEMDQVITEIGGDVVAQVGRSEYKPANFKLNSKLSREKFEEVFIEADVIVSHAGMGTILTALRLKKPLVIFPRLQKFNEHRNDHQLATASNMKRYSNIYIATNKDELISCISSACNKPMTREIELLNRSGFIKKLKLFIENA